MMQKMGWRPKRVRESAVVWRRTPLRAQVDKILQPPEPGPWSRTVEGVPIRKNDQVDGTTKKDDLHQCSAFGSVLEFHKRV